MPKSVIACIAVISIGAAGCRTIEPPAGYVPLRNPEPRKLAAVSAVGTTFAVSEHPNDGGRHADLAYWVTAFKHEKVTLGRYRLEGEEPITAEGGREGRLLDLRLGQGAAEYTWLVALYVNDSRIVTAEAGGPSAQMAGDHDRLIAAMQRVP